MNQIVIADASPLIILQNIQELSLLQILFGELIITQEIKEEFGFDLPDWIKVIEVQDKTRQAVLNLTLDKGEASSIALCLEIPKSLLIIDEKKGRRIAKDLRLNVIGTLGIIVKAKESGLISSVKDLIEKLEKANFYISPSLKANIIESKVDW